MSHTQQAPLAGPAEEPKTGLVRRTLDRLDAWLTAYLEASDPPWSSDPKMPEYAPLDKKEKIAP